MVSLLYSIISSAILTECVLKFRAHTLFWDVLDGFVPSRQQKIVGRFASFYSGIGSVPPLMNGGQYGTFSVLQACSSDPSQTKLCFGRSTKIIDEES